ncbi:MAG: hypothetical protein HS115_18380 [Spirochaetales bacterium]|nr:hypothetical protein [Spirochaetales bacterium]
MNNSELIYTLLVLAILSGQQCDQKNPYVAPQTKVFDRNDCAKIKPGMAEAQVVAIAGHPHATTEADNSKKGRWAWSYSSLSNQSCSITFADAIVESAELFE